MVEMNKWVIKLLMFMWKKNIILGADTIKEEFLKRLKIDLYIEEHVGQKKRKEYQSSDYKPKDFFDSSHMKTFSECQSL